MYNMQRACQTLPLSKLSAELKNTDFWTLSLIRSVERPGICFKASFPFECEAFGAWIWETVKALCSWLIQLSIMAKVS